MAEFVALIGFRVKHQHILLLVQTELSMKIKSLYVAVSFRMQFENQKIKNF